MFTQTIPAELAGGACAVDEVFDDVEVDEVDLVELLELAAGVVDVLEAGVAVGVAAGADAVLVVAVVEAAGADALVAAAPPVESPLFFVLFFFFVVSVDEVSV